MIHAHGNQFRCRVRDRKFGLKKTKKLATAGALVSITCLGISAAE